jgi:hypothetical protein
MLTIIKNIQKNIKDKKLHLDLFYCILTVVAFGGIFVETYLLNTKGIPLHIILVIRTLIIFMVLFSVFMNRLYKRYCKQVKLVVLFTGLIVIINLLGIDLILSICLVFVIAFILIYIPYIKESKNYLSSI